MKRQMIETKRLILRPIYEEDLKDIYEVFSNDKLMETYGMASLTSIDHARDFLQELIKDGEWAITKKDTKQLLGTIGFVSNKKKHKRSEIAFVLKEDFWAKGYMNESLKAVIDKYFQNTNNNRLEAYVYPRNTACVHLLETIGFQKEGHLREYAMKRGRLEDYLLYAILKSEYESDK